MAKKKNKKSHLKKYFKYLKAIFIGLAVGSLIFLLLANNLRFYYFYTNQQKGLKKWKKIAQKNPQYPDAWAKLSLIWYNLQEKDLAQKALSKALRLDPVRKEFQEMAKEINPNLKNE